MFCAPVAARVLKGFLKCYTVNITCLDAPPRLNSASHVTVAKRGSRLCPYHDLELAPAVHARNRAATRRYWERRKLAEALAATGVPRE
jgi:hypothetical protein